MTEKYEYDEVGNWTKKTVFKNGFKNFIYERTIRY